MLVAMWFTMIGCVMLVGFGLVILTFRQWLIDRDHRLIRTRDEQSQRDLSQEWTAELASEMTYIEADPKMAMQRTELELKSASPQVEDSVSR